MSAPPGFGLQVFRAAFDTAAEVRRLSGNIWFEGAVTAEDASAAEIERLAATDHLRLGYALRLGPSTTPAVHSGHAMLFVAQDGALCYRLVLPSSIFARRTSGLLHLGFLYEDLGSFEEWGFPRSWVVISLSEVDPFESYFSLFNADRR